MRYISDIMAIYPLFASFGTLFQEIFCYMLAGFIVLNFACIVGGILRSRAQGVFRAISFVFCDYSARALFIPISGILVDIISYFIKDF